VSEQNLITQHPDYPFSDEFDSSRFQTWLDTFDPGPEIDSPEELLVDEFLRFVQRYAFLETVVQGEIRYELPLLEKSVLDQLSMDGGEWETQAGVLAAAQLELLGNPETPVLDLDDSLESNGIKVVRSIREFENPFGAFFFNGQVGPAFLIAGNQDTGIESYILAHLIGHLLADHDPYRNRICRWDKGFENLEIDARELRADLFARRVLLPEPQLRETLEHLTSAVEAGESEAGSIGPVLSALFGVSPKVLHARLIEMGMDALAGHLSTDGAAAMPGDLPELPNSGRMFADESFFLPDRYANLALACFHERVMERDALSKFLGLSETETESIIQWGQVARIPDSEFDF